MKKMITLLLAVVMLFSFTAMAEVATNVNMDSTWPIVNEEISVTIAYWPHSPNINVEDFWQFVYFDEVTNLDIEWIVLDPSGASERISMMMNSGDMPDAIWGAGFDPTEITNYGAEGGLLYPINELMDYMPNFKAFLEQYPSVGSAITAPDGNWYGMPSYTGEDLAIGARVWVNTEWLAKLNLEHPKTLEEFYNVLVAFRDNDMDGDGDPTNEIPWISAYEQAYVNPLNYILNAYGFLGNGLTLKYGPDGAEVVYTPYDEDYKAVLQFMNKLYTEGLLDPDFFNQSEIEMDAKILTGIGGFADMGDTRLTGVPGMQDSGYWDGTYLLQVDDAHTPALSAARTIGDYGAFVISSACDFETAAALAKLGDTAYDLYWNTMYCWGPSADSEEDLLGRGGYVTEDGQRLFEFPEGCKDQWTYVIQYTCTQKRPGWSDSYLAYGKVGELYPDYFMGQYVNANSDDFTYPNTDWWQFCNKTDPCKQEPLPNFFMTPEDTEEVDRIKLALNEYVETMEARFMSGDVSFDEWDTFVANLEQIGVGRLLEIVGGYYADYIGA